MKYEIVLAKELKASDVIFYYNRDYVIRQVHRISEVEYEDWSDEEYGNYIQFTAYSLRLLSGAIKLPVEIQSYENCPIIKINHYKK